MTRMTFRNSIILIFLVLSFALQGQPVFAATNSTPPKLFGSLEFPKTDLGTFKQWTSVLTRVKKGKALQAAIPDWSILAASLQGLSPYELVLAVNTFVNKVKYQTDPVVWRTDDYWATPEQFYTNTGDCEDYAITKYMILKKLGVAPKDMRIVAVKDLNLKQYHAILALYVEGGHILILDNQAGEVMLSTRIHHYKVMYSINETGWWRHL